MKKEYEEIKSNLKTLCEEFLATADKYINSFSASELLSFGLSKEEAKERITQYDLFTSSAVSFLEKRDSFIAKLTNILYKSYDKNDEEMVKAIGETILEQDKLKGFVSDFMANCEKDISRKEKKVSLQALQRNAISLKQKIASL